VPVAAQQATDGLLKRRQVPLHDLEDAVDVDPEVLVGDQVAKPREHTPSLERLVRVASGLDIELMIDTGLPATTSRAFQS